MTDYFDQQGQVANRLPTAFRGAAATDQSSQYENPFPPLIVPFKEGWAVQPHQPQHLTPEKRAGAVMRGDDGNQNVFRANLTPDIWSGGWPVQAFQPPAPIKRAQQLAASLMRGDDGSQYILIPPWMMAPRPSTFPNYQANPAAAIPSYNAGPQIGAIYSMPNITEPTLLKASPGTLFTINVIVAGTAAGGVYDCNSIASAVQATQFSPIPTTGGPVFLFEWPCQYGIVVVPGAGQVLAAKWC